MRVLVTGAAGSIGRVVTVGLADRGHEIVGLDRLPEPAGFEGPWHSVDCADPDAVAAVFAESAPDGVDDVTRIVYASSNHAVGLTPRRELVSDDVRPRPDTFYGVGKVAAEGLLSLYADRYGIDAIACRIGSFRDRPETARALSTWLSPDDCVRMMDAALTATAPGFAVLYGISANTRAWWDLEPGRRLGYVPQDDAEEFAASIAARPEDEAEAAYVGGPFALSEYHRPALDRA
jgi:uronate dehydrogenase